MGKIPGEEKYHPLLTDKLTDEGTLHVEEAMSDEDRDDVAAARSNCANGYEQALFSRAPI